jgi:GLPGLI family protein
MVTKFRRQRSILEEESGQLGLRRKSKSDGPYKLSGLPGLILKLEDDKGDYKFNFVKKLSIPNSFTEDIKPDARKSTRINFKVIKLL